MNDAMENREKIAQLGWTTFILFFFFLQAILWTTAITLTASDRSHAVVTDYEQQAHRWDELQRQRAASRRLGWTADVEWEQTLPGEPAPFVLQLKDRAGQPVNGATIQLELFHLAEASQRSSVRLTELGDGRYRGTLESARPGRWQLEGIAKHPEGDFLIHQRTQLALTDTSRSQK